ncbi:hypothetical protein VTH06DRAFT_6041 [Thermothelomyces fergusii]
MGLWEVEDYGEVADRACWAMFGVLTVVVLLRICTRLYYGRMRGGGLGIDDYITLGCLVIFLLTCIFITIGSRHGLGRHYTSLAHEDVTAALKWNAIINAVLIWTFSLPKFAIISTLQRILSLGTTTKVVFWALALSSQACVLATSVWWFKQCDPVEYGWDRTIPGGSCAPVRVMANLGYFTSAYSAFLDVVFALYPIPFIMRLNMALGTRIAVAAALGLNAVACVVSIYKLAIFGQIFDILDRDPTYPVPYLDILGMAEGTILVVCASLPTLGPLFIAAKRRISNATGGGSGGSSSSKQLSGQQLRGGTEAVSLGARARGHKRGSDAGEPSRSLHLRPSSDAIPLVATAQKSGMREDDLEGGGIHRTMEVSVSSEAKTY